MGFCVLMILFSFENSILSLIDFRVLVLVSGYVFIFLVGGMIEFKNGKVNVLVKFC